MTRSPFAMLGALLILAVSSLAVGDETYSCLYPDGARKIANTNADPTVRRDKNCKVISSGPENAVPAPPKAKPASAASHSASPSGFPRVQEDTQKARDGDRRHILEQELAGEQRNLEQAKKELAEQEATRGGPSDRTAPYRDRVGQHERNIQAIQKELSNLR